jgi:predicted molibdopterin-dependent oxidoreductase YjgC
MMIIYIDGQEYQASERESVLQVARRHGFETIPALCYHPALETEGSCRMCVVEVEGETLVITTACTLMARDGLRVWTDTEAVRISRKITLLHLLERAPESSCLKEWAEYYNLELTGVTGTIDETSPDCILCGLCVKACTALGIEALQFLGKGKDRQVKLIMHAGHSPCIGCRACEWLCASHSVHVEIKDYILRMNHWGLDLPLATCKSCGRAYATQAAVVYIKARVPSSRARIGLCPECKRVASLPARLRYQPVPDK